MQRRLIKNAVSNVGRGCAAAIIALVLPPVLIRHMHSENYAVWVLILQVSAYMGFLDFGLQTAVGRYIAFAEEKKDFSWRDGIFSTAMTGLCIAALLGILAVVVIAACARHIFPEVPGALVPPMRIAILIAGASTAVGLPASAWNGVFVGRQRFEVPAITVASGKIVTSVGLIAAAVAGHSLVFMACVLAASNLLTYSAQYLAFRQFAPGIRYQFALVTRKTVREISAYCLSLSVWSFSTLLVTGFDLILVGRFDFSQVPVYSASAVLITFLGGLQASLFGVIMPHSATLHASDDAKALGGLLLKATTLAAIFLLLTGLPLLVFAGPIIKVWLGTQFASAGTSVLCVLVVGNMVRLICVPYASILVGTGQQRLVVLSPVAEGISNLIASLILGMKFGAIGVAWGTLIGAVVGVALSALYSLRKTRQWIDVSAFRVFRQVFLIVAGCTFPFLIAIPLVRIFDRHAQLLINLATAISMSTCLLILAYSTLHDRRHVS